MTKKTILTDAKNISLSLPKGAAGNRFCEIWPTAKTGLNLLKDMVKNPILKTIIATIITAGDAVASRVCG